MSRAFENITRVAYRTNHWALVPGSGRKSAGAAETAGNLGAARSDNPAFMSIFFYYGTIFGCVLSLAGCSEPSNRTPFYTPSGVYPRRRPPRRPTADSSLATDASSGTTGATAAPLPCFPVEEGGARVYRKSLASRCAATSRSGPGSAARSIQMARYRCTMALSGWWDSSKGPSLSVSLNSAVGHVNRTASTYSC